MLIHESIKINCNNKYTKLYDHLKITFENLDEKYLCRNFEYMIIKNVNYNVKLMDIPIDDYNYPCDHRYLLHIAY